MGRGSRCFARSRLGACKHPVAELRKLDQLGQNLWRAHVSLVTTLSPRRGEALEDALNVRLLVTHLRECAKTVEASGLDVEL